MRRSLFVLLLLPLLAPIAQAAPAANEIAVLCQQTYPGQRGVQSYCIKQHRNYYDWLQFERKRVYNNKKQLGHLDSCLAEHQPNYREAFDCVREGPGLLGLF